MASFLHLQRPTPSTFSQRCGAVWSIPAVGHTRLCPVPAPLTKMTLQPFPTSVRPSGGPENLREGGQITIPGCPARAAPPCKSFQTSYRIPCRLSFQPCLRAFPRAQHPSRGCACPLHRRPFPPRGSARPAAPAGATAPALLPARVSGALRPGARRCTHPEKAAPASPPPSPSGWV